MKKVCGNTKNAAVLLSLLMLATAGTSRSMGTTASSHIVSFVAKALISAVITGAISIPFFVKYQDGKHIMAMLHELPWHKIFSLAALSGIGNALFYTLLSRKAIQALDQPATSSAKTPSFHLPDQSNNPELSNLIGQLSIMLNRINEFEKVIGKLKEEESKRLEEWFAEKQATMGYLQQLYRELLGDKSAKIEGLSAEAPVADSVRESALLIGKHIRVVANECIARTMQTEREQFEHQRKALVQQDKVRVEGINEHFRQIENRLIDIERQIGSPK